MKPAKRIFLLPLILLPSLMQNCAEVLQKTLTNDQVTLSAPVNNLVSGDSVQTFYWQPLTDAQSYELQIVSPGFDSIVRFITDTTLQNNVFNFTLLSGQYQWRVRAINSVSMGPFCLPWNFSIN